MHSSYKITEPIIGKTYSLYNNSLSSDGFFGTTSKLVDLILADGHDEKYLLDLIRNFSGKKRLLKNLLLSGDNSELGKIVKTLHESLSHYTGRVNQHLKELPFHKRFSKTMMLSQEQYHLYMIEIELVNRINKNIFVQSETKYAFLPHCMHDLSKECLSAPDEVDYVCKACSKDCSINEMSRLLRKYKVKPYLWKEANLKKLFKQVMKQSKSFSVLGVACIPELVNGMRLCARVDVPVVGSPLDANRCMRWWGEFHENTVNVKNLRVY
jgi:hypothetical protein